MAILEGLINGAVESSTSLPDLLRRLKVLASRLGNNELLTWVNLELEGYGPKNPLPDYRMFQVQSFGNFYGAFGRRLTHAPIPLSSIPEEFHEVVYFAKIRESISALENLISNSSGESLKILWSADLIKFNGQDIYQDMVCLSAWQQISIGSLLTILETIRSRLLNFVLELEKIDPKIGSYVANDKEFSNERVDQIFNTVILGNVNYQSSIDQSFNSHVEVKFEDFQSLNEYLMSNKVSEEDIKELKPILEEMKEKKSNSWSEDLQKWVGKMLAKAASGVWAVSVNVASNVLVNVIIGYLGRP